MSTRAAWLKWRRINSFSSCSVNGSWNEKRWEKLQICISSERVSAVGGIVSARHGTATANRPSLVLLFGGLWRHSEELFVSVIVVCYP